MYTFGSTELKIIMGSYRASYASNNTVEIPLLAGEGPASVVQQNGRGRYVISFDAYVATISEYNTLRTDYLALTARTFTGPETGTFMLFDLTQAEAVLPNLWKFSVTLMEV